MYSRQRALGIHKFCRPLFGGNEDVFAKRLQIPEWMTNRIVDSLTKIVAPRGVVVFAEATHVQMCTCGVKEHFVTTGKSRTAALFETDERGGDCPNCRGQLPRRGTSLLVLNAPQLCMRTSDNAITSVSSGSPPYSGKPVNGCTDAAFAARR